MNYPREKFYPADGDRPMPIKGDPSRMDNTLDGVREPEIVMTAKLLAPPKGEVVNLADVGRLRDAVAHLGCTMVSFEPIEDGKVIVRGWRQCEPKLTRNPYRDMTTLELVNFLETAQPTVENQYAFKEVARALARRHRSGAAS